MSSALRRAWAACAAWCALTAAVFAVYALSKDGASRELLALTASFVLLAALTAGAALVLRRAAPPAWLDQMRAVCARAWARWALTLAVLGGLFGYGLMLRPEWPYALGGVALAAAAALILITFDGLPENTRPRIVVSAAVLGIAGVYVVRALVLAAVPAYNVADEPWTFGWILSVLRDGAFRDAIMAYGGMDVQRYYYLPALFMRVFGADFWTARLFSLLVTAAVVAISAGAAGAWYQRREAAWIGGLLALGSALLANSATIRHDNAMAFMLGACLLFLALGAHAADQRRARLWHGLAGLMLGLGWMAHYHAVPFAAILTLTLIAPRVVLAPHIGLTRRAALLQTLAWIAGGLLGAAVTFVVQIVPDWAQFTQRVPYAPGSLEVLVQRYIEYLATLPYHSQLEALLIGAGLALAAWRAGSKALLPAFRLQLAGLAAALPLLILTFAVVAAHVAVSNYLFQLVAVYIILITGLFVPGIRALSGERRPLPRASWAAALCFALVGIGTVQAGPLRYVLAGGPQELTPRPAADYVRANARPDDRITGEHWYYFFLNDLHFISPYSYEYASYGSPDVYAQYADATAFWDAIAPEWVIRDPNLSSCCFPPIIDSAYLNSRGYQVVAEFPGERLPVQVYHGPHTGG